MKTIRYTLLTLALATVVVAGAFAVGPHKFSAEQARAIALKKYPGKVVGKIPLENEEGKWEYAVTVVSGKTMREVMVGADSGKIENVEVTTAAGEANEATADAKKGKIVKEEDEKNEKNEIEDAPKHKAKHHVHHKHLKAKAKTKPKVHKTP